MATVDLSGLNRLLREKAVLAGVPVQTEALNEMMRFVRQIIKFTPPSVNKATAAAMKANNPGLKSGGVKRAGENAITGDLNRAIAKLSTNDVKSPLLKRALDTGRADILQKFLDLPAGKKIGAQAVAGGAIARTHTSARNRRGRVNKDTGNVTLDREQWEIHRTQLVKRIGYMKAGWLEGWNALKKAKGWKAAPKMVSRHASYAKSVGRIQMSNDLVRFEMVNQTKGIKVIRHAVTSALKHRERAIARNVKFLLRRSLKK